MCSELECASVAPSALQTRQKYCHISFIRGRLNKCHELTFLNSQLLFRVRQLSDSEYNAADNAQDVLLILTTVHYILVFNLFEIMLVNSAQLISASEVKCVKHHSPVTRLTKFPALFSDSVPG